MAEEKKYECPVNDTPAVNDPKDDFVVMNNPSSAEPEREVPVVVDANGVPTARSTTTPTDNTARAVAYFSPPDVMPVLFLPGIMGSILVGNDKKKETIWNPDKLGYNLKSAFLYGPETRQELLQYAKARCYHERPIKLPKDCIISEKEAIARRWGGVVFWGPKLLWKKIAPDNGYGPFLIYLENQLNKYNLPNHQTEWKEALRETAKPEWDAQKPFEGLDLSALKQYVGKYYMPVYACGYNWLQTNAKSAEDAHKWLTEIKAKYQKSPYFNFKGFIIVTHSMGGLVGRKLAQLDAECSNDIKAVIHGVQPVHGAGAVYSRFIQGTEVRGSGLGVLKGLFMSSVFGIQAKHTNPVFSHNPGPMELLPNKYYNKGQPWLTLKATTVLGQEVTAQLPTPGGSPYDEIYKQKGVFWEMVTESQINPAKQQEGGDYENFTKELKKVETYHDEVNAPGKRFHPNTYLHVGIDNGEALTAIGKLTWAAKGAPVGLTPEVLKLATRTSTDASFKLPSMSTDKEAPKAPVDYEQTRSAMVIGKPLEFKMEIDFTPGDSTVPQESSELHEDDVLKQAFILKGVDHAASYAHKDVHHTVLYSIVSILKGFDKPPETSTTTTITETESLTEETTVTENRRPDYISKTTYQSENLTIVETRIDGTSSQPPSLAQSTPKM